jgi:hypothetical protein
MVFATGLTLYVVPAFYSYLSKEKKGGLGVQPKLEAIEHGHAQLGSLDP